MMPIYVLIRTSNRPKFFETMMKSVKEQTYPNIVTIVHSDNENDTYVQGDIVIRSEHLNEGSAPYNLYCNKLLEAIPSEGWYCFLDDDDMYCNPTTIEKLASNAKEDYINVGKVHRGIATLPIKFKDSNVFHTEGFLLHTKYKNLAQWNNRRRGDFFYTRQITDKLPINWVDMVICKMQEGKGCGRREDKINKTQTKVKLYKEI